MDDESSSTSDQPQAKRRRLLACRRCRQRKQKCGEERPCTNCTKAEEECVQTAPVSRAHVDAEYVRVLEEKIAELESLDPQQSLDHLQIPDTSPIVESNGHATLGNESTMQAPPEAPHRRPPIRRQSEAATAPTFGARHARRDNDEPALNPLALGLVTSPSVQHSEHSVSVSQPSPLLGDGNIQSKEYQPHALVAKMLPEQEILLFETYRERAQAQYPFFHWNAFLSWHLDWKHCPSTEYTLRGWQGFFTNMVFATSLLLLRRPDAGGSDVTKFYDAGMSLLPSALAMPDKMLHVQAYLLLSIYALHQSSTEMIISLVSTAMRYCVQQQLHLSETEPIASDPSSRIKNQIRRRCFWVAYKLDRLVMSSFDLPPSIPDAMISVNTYANINDEDLMQVSTDTPLEESLPDSPFYTCVSSSLHILQCRRIQSEISAVTLQWDYCEHYELVAEWRLRILAELENYKSRVQRFSDPQSKGYTSQRWLAMIYHYTLLMLYRPSKQTVLGPAGDLSVQASTQACLMFRKVQMDRQIAQPWLALLVQFQSGVTLLYCFWATPPEHRTENYRSANVPNALRACSNVLAIMADRWAKADILRDTFELLASEIPTSDSTPQLSTRLPSKAVIAIREMLPRVRDLVVHRPTLRMIEEMISEDFPRSSNVEMDASPPAVARISNGSTLVGQQSGSALPHPATMAFQLPFSTPHLFSLDGMGDSIPDSGNFGSGSFPGMFEFESWS